MRRFEQIIYVLDICWNRLNEAIRTNIQNICFFFFFAERRTKQGIFIYHSVHYGFFTIENSLKWQFFGNKCCRFNEGPLYEIIV